MKTRKTTVIPFFLKNINSVTSEYSFSKTTEKTERRAFPWSVAQRL